MKVFMNFHQEARASEEALHPTVEGVGGVLSHTQTIREVMNRVVGYFMLGLRLSYRQTINLYSHVIFTL